MKTGDFVKLKNGYIDEIDWLGELKEDIYGVHLSKEPKKRFHSVDEIIKSSPNIINLIEVGDILSFENGSICRIMEIDNDLNPPYYLLKDYGGDEYWERQEYLSDMKSIVTKEQFESMEYKVGEQ